MKNKIKKLIGLILSSVMIFSLAGCGSSNKEESIVINDGEFTEMKLIHRMVKMIVEENTDLKVDIKDQMSQINSYNELIKGNSDIMNSYDGTLLTTFLKKDVEDVPEGESIYDYVNKLGSEQEGIRLLKKLGLNNTYSIAVKEETAEKYNLEKISDLTAVAGELVFGAEHEFFGEEGSMKFTPFSEFYGLKFKESSPIEMQLKYSAIDSDNIDVVVVYRTDGLNKKSKLKVLEDDKNFFPEYNGAILVREDLFERFKEKAPELESEINKLGGIFTDEIMTDLSYAVDVDGKEIDTVAREFLQSKNIIKK